MSSFNPQSFILAYHTLYTYGLSLIVKVCTLVFLLLAHHLEVCACYAQDKMTYHLHPILHTSDAFTTCTPVTVSFHAKQKTTTTKKEKTTTTNTEWLVIFVRDSIFTFYVSHK